MFVVFTFHVTNFAPMLCPLLTGMAGMAGMTGLTGLTGVTGVAHSNLVALMYMCMEVWVYEKVDV